MQTPLKFPNHLLHSAQRYHALGAHIAFVADKRAVHRWKEVSTTDAPAPENITTFSGKPAWSAATGIAALSTSDWACIDIDANENGNTLPVVTTLLEHLGLPADYDWVVRTGSGFGYHIWLRCKCEERLKSSPWFLPQQEYKAAFSHMELRIHTCYTVLPPSVHPSGLRYEFVGEEPTSAPVYVEFPALLKALETVSVPRDSIYQQRPLLAAQTPTGSVPARVSKEQLDAIKHDFDLVAAIKKHLETEIVTVEGEEYRIGERGAGHGGWYVTTDRKLWNTFSDGSGERGGDCFDLAGFLIYGEAWDRNDAKMFLSTVAKAASETGVSLDTDHGAPVSASHQRLGVEQVETFIKARFRMRMNTVTGRLEWSPLWTEVWAAVTDQQVNLWLVELEKATGMILSKERWNTYTDNPAIAVPFDPIREYFEGLVWDGYDHLGYLVSCTQVDDPATFWEYLRTWLVASYACGYYGGNRYPNELFLVLSGPQGRGKTTFLRTVIPPALQAYTHNGSIDESKDALILLSESFISINDELTSLRKADVEHIKSLLSLDAIRIRRPYDRHPKMQPRRFSCCGTTNETEFLTDATGNRRFLITEVLNMNFEGLKLLNVDQLWAQVRHLFNSGEVQHFLSREQTEELERRNTGFRLVSREEDLVLKYLERTEKDDPYVRYCTTGEVAELLAKLFDLDNTVGMDRNGVPRLQITPSMIRTLGVCLKAQGFVHESVRTDKGSRRCYRLKVKPWMKNNITYYPPV